MGLIVPELEICDKNDKESRLSHNNNEWINERTEKSSLPDPNHIPGHVRIETGGFESLGVAIN